MNVFVKSLLLGAMGAALLAGAARAADIIEEPPLEPLPEVPVEVGSGWYLRGDVSYDFETKYKGNYTTYSDPSSCSASVCGSGFGTADYDEWKIDDGVDFGAGFGYQFTDYFRGDVTAHYWKHDLNGQDSGYSCGTACGSHESGDVKAWEVMANAYVDLGTFAGFTPYAGGGLGAVHVKYSDIDSLNYDAVGTHYLPDSFEGSSDWRFAYALMAGVSYDLTQALKLDIGYRYVNVDDGKMFGKNALGGVVSGGDEGFDRHTIQAGLRYSLF